MRKSKSLVRDIVNELVAFISLEEWLRFSEEDRKVLERALQEIVESYD